MSNDKKQQTQTEPIDVVIETERARRLRLVMATRAEAEASRLDYAETGGRYLTASGELVDANGRPVPTEQDNS